MREMSPNTRVWIYQADRTLTQQEVEKMQNFLNDFCVQWTSHNQQLTAVGRVIENLFVVLMADETQASASGCSIDKSVHFVKSLESTFGISLFDRMNFAYDKNGEVLMANRMEFEKLFKEGEIDENTIVFDTLVKTKSEFEQGFRKPLKSSWHQKFV